MQKSSVKTINDLSTTAFVDHLVSADELEKGGLAILPTRLNMNAGKKPEVRIVENLLNKEVRSQFPGIHIVDYQMINHYSPKSLRKKWIDTLVSHSSPHSIRGSETVQALSLKMGVRYLLQSDIRIADIEGGAEHVRIFGRLWDAKTREIIWSGYGEARGYVYLFFPAVPASFEKAAYRAVKGLVLRLPFKKAKRDR